MKMSDWALDQILMKHHVNDADYLDWNIVKTMLDRGERGRRLEMSLAGDEEAPSAGSSQLLHRITRTRSRSHSPSSSPRPPAPTEGDHFKRKVQEPTFRSHNLARHTLTALKTSPHELAAASSSVQHGGASGRRSAMLSQGAWRSSTPSLKTCSSTGMPLCR